MADKAGGLPKPVKRTIKPVRQTADAINSLIKYLGMTKGAGGIKVTVAPAGLLIEYRPTAAPGGQGGGGFQGEGSSGDLNELHFDNGSMVIDIDGNGIRLEAGGNIFTVNSSGILQWADVDGNAIVFEGGDIQITNASNGKSITLSYADITQNMGIKTFTGCDSGSPASYDTIASDFY